MHSRDLDIDENIRDPVEDRRTLAERSERLHDQLRVSEQSNHSSASKPLAFTWAYSAFIDSVNCRHWNRIWPSPETRQRKQPTIKFIARMFAKAAISIRHSEKFERATPSVALTNSKICKSVRAINAFGNMVAQNCIIFGASGDCHSESSTTTLLLDIVFMFPFNINQLLILLLRSLIFYMIVALNLTIVSFNCSHFFCFYAYISVGYKIAFLVWFTPEWKWIICKAGVLISSV